MDAGLLLRKKMESDCGFLGKCVGEIAPMAVLVAVVYICVFMAVMADLFVAMRRTRIEGVRRTSRGFRRTVDKLTRYYAMLLAMTVTDAIVTGAVVYLRVVHGAGLPSLPLFTTICGAGLALIEAKSIYEKSVDKADMKEIADLARRLARDPALVRILERLLG